MKTALNLEALSQIFYTARTYNGWTDTPVPEELVYQLYDLLKWGPTASNTSPARFVWVRSPEGKAELAAVAMGPNKLKLLEAPLTVIIGNDLGFAKNLSKLVTPERVPLIEGMLNGASGLTETMALRNGTLQGAYLILAARALGLDCGPMSGFDNAGVDRAFFTGTRIQSNFICCLGYGKPEAVHARGPRLSFSDTGHFA